MISFAKTDRLIPIKRLLTYSDEFNERTNRETKSIYFWFQWSNYKSASTMQIASSATEIHCANLQEWVPVLLSAPFIRPWVTSKQNAL